MELQEFIRQLASGSPIPGGGGASALAGGVGAALCSMVANLTSGKQKYADCQADMEWVLRRTEVSIPRLLALIEQDAAAFAPLAAAYGIPKGEPGREAILENALVAACAVPLELMEEIADIAGALEILVQKGTRLAVSDVGAAACILRSALEGAALNVFINTKLMQNRPYAAAQNEKAEVLLTRFVPSGDAIYRQVKEGLVKQ